MDALKDIFKFKKPANSASPGKKLAENQAALAETALKTIHDGIIMTDKSGIIQFINPAAVTMTESGSADHAIGLDYGLVIKLETKEGRELSEEENPLIQAMKTGRTLEPCQLALISGKSDKRIPISISMSPAEGLSANRIITFRNITQELEEEGEQTEFISTASHEMRTPVATIDGYLSLTLNPQTATIDERARGYLTAAQIASKHLGKLFQDLLDVTKLDDGKIRPHFEPVEMTSLVKSIADDYIVRARESKINFNFGSTDGAAFDSNRRLEQVVYGYVDINFLREILDNLIENAIKYTPTGGSVYVNVRGDGDRVLINVTDTGIGISAEDLGHIFQKFYRVDNSDTREIGGTGLGLYIVKQRVEAMGGRVWAESAFGEGSTFFISLPRLTNAEYEKRMIVVRNQQLQPQATTQQSTTQQSAISQPDQPQPTISQLAQVPQPPISQSNPVTQTTAPQPTPLTQSAAPQSAVSQSPINPQPVAAQPMPEPIPAPTPTSAPPSAPASTASPPPTPPAPPVASTSIQPQPVNQIINNNLNGEAK